MYETKFYKLLRKARHDEATLVLVINKIMPLINKFSEDYDGILDDDLRSYLIEYAISVVKDKEFAYKITPKENWSLFQYGSFNNIKDKLTDNNGNIIKTNKRIIEEYGSKKVLSMMFRCFKNSPKISTIALIELTKYTYTICNDYEPFVLFNPEYRYHSLPYHENIILQNICKGYNNFATKTFPHIFMCLGLMHWILIAVVLAEYKSNKSHFWKKIFFIVPIFCNNFGTTLLLTGNKDSFRFFYYTFLVIPLLLIIIYKKPEVD